MDRQKVLVNIFSNWTHLLVLILIAFFVSPIIVHQLGNELYGIWTLIVSITGYFTILNFGVNTAIIRFVSMYVAQKETQKANEVYNTSFVFFFLVSLVIIIITLIFGVFFHDLFYITRVTRYYVYAVFVIVGVDIAFSLLFGVLGATLGGLQEFLKRNIVAMTLTLLKNCVLVFLLLRGYRLLSLALTQFVFNALRHLLHYLIIRKKYRFFQVCRAACKMTIFKQICHYSVYSFIIALTGRIIFLTDSIVIGSIISVSEVTFYAIPATLIEYLGKVVGAITNVLVPVISSQDAVGEKEKNKTLYIIVTRYLLALSLPIMFVLFTVGDDFIGIWMGKEYGLRATWILRILLIGYIFSFSQWIAYGVLMGISKHRFLAYVYIVEAAANLGISIVLGKLYGIEGVALGTTIPLLIVNIFVIPPYTCHVLDIPVLRYYRQSHVKPFLLFILSGILYMLFPIHVSSYLQLFVYSAGVAIFWAVVAFFTMLEQDHRQWVLKGFDNF